MLESRARIVACRSCLGPATMRPATPSGTIAGGSPADPPSSTRADHRSRSSRRKHAHRSSWPCPVRGHGHRALGVFELGHGQRGQPERHRRRPTRAPASRPGKAHTAPTDWSKAKIGVVTDIGTLNDKNFNEYSFKGAEAGADRDRCRALRSPSSRRTRPSTRRTSRSSSTRATTSSSRSASTSPTPTTCSPRRTRRSGSSASTSRRSASTRRARPTRPSPARATPRRCSRTTSRCSSRRTRPATSPGSSRRRISKTGEIGAIGGTTLVCAVRPLHPGLQARREVGQPEHQGQHGLRRPATSRQGLQRPGRRQGVRGRSSSRPTRRWTSCSRSPARPATASSTRPAPRTSTGIGVDVDQFLSYPAADKCIVTSAEKHLQMAVADAIKAIAGGTASAGDNAVQRRRTTAIGVVRLPRQGHADHRRHRRPSWHAALAAMKAGTLDDLPDRRTCGVGPK